MENRSAYSSDCPTRQILDRVADKWAVLVLGLLIDAPMRFNSLRRTVDGISQKMLSQTLKALERDGLVSREVFPTTPITVEYSITSLGRSLACAMEALRTWAEENMDAVVAHQVSYDAGMQATSDIAVRRVSFSGKALDPIPLPN